MTGKIKGKREFVTDMVRHGFNRKEVEASIEEDERRDPKYGFLSRRGPKGEYIIVPCLSDGSRSVAATYVDGSFVKFQNGQTKRADQYTWEVSTEPAILDPEKGKSYVRIILDWFDPEKTGAQI